MQPAADRRKAAGVLAPFAAALALLALVVWLGMYVSAHGEPPALWAFAKAVRGTDLRLAWAFTNCGWAQVLAPLYLVCIIVAIRSRAWRERMIYLVASALVAWGAADRLQWIFMRPRRTDWLLKHETSFSYPSSHASISTAFYLLAGILLVTSDLPRPWRLSGFAAGCILWLGILWSRLSLAAHYPTDVAGGVALGGAIALLGAAVLGWRASRAAVAN